VIPLAPVALPHVLVVAAALFCLGLLTVATRRNAVAILMGVELILNGSALNLVAFSRFVEGGVAGQAFAVFVLVLAAASAAVALAIVLAVFRNFRSIDANDTSTLRG
jgi:NADH-quinone oxidoreductase subunit K